MLNIAYALAAAESLSLVYNRLENDIYNLSVGFVICWGAGILLKYIVADVINDHRRERAEERRVRLAEHMQALRNDEQLAQHQQQEMRVAARPLIHPAPIQTPYRSPQGEGGREGQEGGRGQNAPMLIPRASPRLSSQAARLRRGVQLLVSATIKWTSIALKVFGLGALWLVVPPLLLGTLMESIIVIPARTSWVESPVYPWLQVWALGLIFLKIFLRCVLVGAVGNDGYRLVLERILQQGFAHLDATFIFKEAISPFF